jgi:transposase
MTSFQTLAALVTHRRHLMEMRAAGENRLGSARLRAGLRAHIRWLQRQLARFHTDLDQTIRSHPGWQVQDDLLLSAPGHGTQDCHRLAQPVISTPDA